MNIITVGINIRCDGNHVGWIKPTITGEMFAEELERLSQNENENEELEDTRKLLKNANEKLQYKIELMYREDSINTIDSDEILELIEEKDYY